MRAACEGSYPVERRMAPSLRAAPRSPDMFFGKGRVLAQRVVGRFEDPIAASTDRMRSGKGQLDASGEAFRL